MLTPPRLMIYGHYKLLLARKTIPPNVEKNPQKRAGGALSKNESFKQRFPQTPSKGFFCQKVFSFLLRNETTYYRSRWWKASCVKYRKAVF